ncbi:MAG: SDR family oxidoreductase, partial [Selenomonadaceae bacterium]|nr:SDR family oxidoreductase [Selenomonadaceae bacterium]
EDMTEELFDEVMAVNVKGTYFMCRYAVPELRRQEGASIVNVSSDAGVHGNYGCTAYSASKGAVTMFTRSLALELASFGVRVNCVCPGDILTPMTEAQLALGGNREEMLREMQSVYPLGRIGTAEEAAAVIFFLASPAASFVTGAAWGVDGGITA